MGRGKSGIDTDPEQEQAEIRQHPRPQQADVHPDGPFYRLGGVDGRESMNDVVLLEIRGVGGATAEEILGGPVLQTSGDDLAGFFRRDAADEGETEAYEWGKLTSGSRTSALWWILFPFTLMNVAGWMFRPSVTERGQAHEQQRSSLWFGRLLMVGGGLAITAAYVLWVTALTTEMAAFGCSSDQACSQRWYMAPVTMFGPDNGVWLVTLGIGLAALLVLGLFVFILRTQDRLEGYETDPSRRLLDVMTSTETSRLRRNTRLEDQAFWYKWAEHRRLFRWHLGLALVLLGGAAGHALRKIGWSAPAGTAWLAIAGVIAVILALVWALTAPERFREANEIGEQTTTVSTARVLWLIRHLVLAAAGGGVAWVLTGWLDSDGSAGFGFLAAVRALSIVLYIAAAFLVILLARRKRQRPEPTTWPTALMPGFAAALAVIITGAGFAAVANLLGRFLLGADWVRATGFNIVIVDLLLLSLGIAGVIAGLRIWRTGTPTDEVITDYFGAADAPLSERERGWVESVARTRLIATLPGKADGFLAVLTVVLVVLNVIQFAAGGFDATSGPDGAFASPLFGIEGLSFFHTAAATATVLYLFPGLQLIRRMSQSRDSRRQLGKVWDVFSFWPRRFHPLAAPCYAERAVPEFRNRIRRHLADGKGVIVSAHSQGTVIAFAALVQIAAEQELVTVAVPEAEGQMTYGEFEAMVQEAAGGPGLEAIGTPAAPERVLLDRVGLVTFGSPLSALYGRFFPWHFGAPNRFQSLRDELARIPEIGRGWRNLYRKTDYIGRRVFIAPGGELKPPDACADVEVPAAAQPLFPIESHSNYEKTAELRDTVDRFVTGIAQL